MPVTRLRLTSTSVGRWLLLAPGLFVSGWFGWSCLQGSVAPGEPWWMRLLAGVFAGLFLGPWLVLPLTVRSRLRWMEFDNRGLRLVRGSGAVAVDLRWDELAGVGVLVDEAAAQRAPRGREALFRAIMHRVPPWLELVPAGAAVVRAHPELGPQVPAGDGQPARWLVRVNEGWARRPELGEHVARYAPGLWRGERDGSVPRVLTPLGQVRRASGQVPPAVLETVPPETVATAEPTERRRPETAAAGGPEQVLDLPRGRQIRRWATVLVICVLVVTAVLLVPAPLDRPVAAAYSLVVMVGFLALVQLLVLRVPRRLVADAGSLRLVRGSRAPDWRVPWTDVSAIRMERHGTRATLFVRPTGPDAVDAHPLLDPYWRAGRRVEWRLPVGVVGSEWRAVRDLVLRRRPDLWAEEAARPV